QHLDLVADRGLGHAQLGPSSGEAAVARRRLEGADGRERRQGSGGVQGHSNKSSLCIISKVRLVVKRAIWQKKCIETRKDPSNDHLGTPASAARKIFVSYHPDPSPRRRRDRSRADLRPRHAARDPPSATAYPE